MPRSLTHALALSTCLSAAAYAAPPVSNQQQPTDENLIKEYNVSKARGFCTTDPSSGDVTLYAYQGLDTQTKQPILTPEFKATHSTTKTNYAFYGQYIQDLASQKALPKASILLNTERGCSLSFNKDADSTAVTRYFYMPESAKNILLAPGKPDLEPNKLTP
jgi:hypothetical protein